jgi:hypothetical protein
MDELIIQYNIDVDLWIQQGGKNSNTCIYQIHLIVWCSLHQFMFLKKDYLRS